MRLPRPRLLPLPLGALLVLAAVLLAGCGVDTPQNTFAPEGEVADKQRDIFNLALWPAVAVFVIVEAALVVAVLRFRHRGEKSLPKQVHGNTRLEIAWTILPALLILTLGGITVPVIADLGREPKADALQVTAIGRQWLWQFEYPDLTDAQGKPLSSFGELHIPVGREIGVTLVAEDVIHSFWVPRLAGKLDVIPGRNNRMWLSADQPGSFSGQCAEFCGLGHADMRFVVVAETPAEFDEWSREKLAAQAEGGADEPSVASYGD